MSALALALAQYLQLWDMVAAITLDESQQDAVVWRFETGDEFSTSSAYHLFFAPNQDFGCESKAPPRLKFFMWLVVHGRCLTADNLERRGWPNQGACVLCGAAQESCTHLFVHCHCRFATEVWLRFHDWLGTSFPIPACVNRCTKDWLHARKAAPKQLRRDFDMVVILVHRCIWKERNARIFTVRPCRGGERGHRGPSFLASGRLFCHRCRSLVARRVLPCLGCN